MTNLILNSRVFCTLLLVLACPAAAEPTASVNYMMSEPLSTFTYGMDNMARDLKEIQIDDYVVYIFVEYDWEFNAIQVSGNLHADDNLTLRQLSDACEMFVRKAKNLFGVNSFTGQRIAGGSVVNNYFLQRGINRKTGPDNFDSELESMVLIKGYVSANNANIVCGSQLLANTITFEEI